MGQQGKAVKIDSDDYDAIKDLCEVTGHKIGFHIKRAISNYLNDEGPVWRDAAEKMQAKLKKTVRVSV